jgi:hypothetical protein
MKPERFDPTRYLVAPDVDFDRVRIQAFEGIWETIDAHSASSIINYACPFPKFEFLTYLVRRKGVLLHGSNDPGITRFEPRQRTDFRGRVRESVFATDDGIWPIYFAIVDRDRVKILRNACFQVADEQGVTRTHYLFAVPARQLHQHPWREGTVYILPRETFVQDQIVDAEGRVWKEWASGDHHLAVSYISPYRTEPVTIVNTILANLQHERYHLGQVRYLKVMMRRVS